MEMGCRRGMSTRHFALNKPNNLLHDKPCPTVCFNDDKHQIAALIEEVLRGKLERKLERLRLRTTAT